MGMSFKKASSATVERFQAALPRSPLVEPRRMFGYPVSFVHGHFFTGLHEENVVLRLPGGLRDRLPDMAGAAGFDPMQNGRGMKDWYVVPPTVSTSPSRLAALLEAALPLVAVLPPKPTKKKRPKTSEQGRKPAARAARSGKKR